MNRFILLLLFILSSFISLNGSFASVEKDSRVIHLKEYNPSAPRWDGFNWHGTQTPTIPWAPSLGDTSGGGGYSNGAAHGWDVDPRGPSVGDQLRADWGYRSPADPLVKAVGALGEQIRQNEEHFQSMKRGWEAQDRRLEAMLKQRGPEVTRDSIVAAAQEGFRYRRTASLIYKDITGIDPDSGTLTSCAEFLNFKNSTDTLRELVWIKKVLEDDRPLEDTYPENWIPTAVAVRGIVSATVGISTSLCFPGDTPVCIADGTLPINRIKRGDSIRSCTSHKGRTLCQLSQVAEVYVNFTDYIVKVPIAGQLIRVTPNHPFYVANKGWLEAKDLRPGYQLITMSGSPVYVTGMPTNEFGDFEVFNLNVEGSHTYYVGIVGTYEGDGVLVHNCNPATRQVIFEAAKAMRQSIAELGITAKAEFGEFLNTSIGRVWANARTTGRAITDMGYKFFKRTDGIHNPFPSDGRFARVIERQYVDAIKKGEGYLGRQVYDPYTREFVDEVFVTAAEEIEHIKSFEGVAKKLSLYTDPAGTQLKQLKGSVIMEFRFTNEYYQAIRSPISTVKYAREYGYLPGGKAAGGAREWLINNTAAINKQIDLNSIIVKEIE